MQKLLVIVICLFFPIFAFPDLNPLWQLTLAGILYEIKIAICLIAISIIAVFWSVVTFFKFLLRGFQFNHFVEVALSLLIFFGALAITKSILRNLHQRPLRLLRGEFSLVDDIKKTPTKLNQFKNDIITITSTIRKLVMKNKMKNKMVE
jgi:hypothetical protein